MLRVREGSEMKRIHKAAAQMRLPFDEEKEN